MTKESTKAPTEVRYLSGDALDSDSLAEVAGRMTRIALDAKRFWGYPESWIEEWTPILTFTVDRVVSGHFWGAFQGPTLVGFAELIAPDEHGTATLENMWIEPASHGRGLGRQCFLALRRRALDLDGRRLEVLSDPNAVGFYRRLGFEAEGEHHSTVQGHPRVLPVLAMALTTP